jgi:aspartate kinase
LQQSGLDAVHVDAREVMVTDERFMQAAPLYGPTNERLGDVVTPLRDAGRIAVLGGFIGRTRDGRPSTLGRGGSDLSASVVGAGIGADEIQIWTDVDGIMTADPAMVSEAKRLPQLSFAEAAELAYFGGRVLHPSTVWPAVDRNIPVRVLNSQKSDAQGTLIVADCQPSPLTVKSIVYKEGITVIDIRSSRMLMSHGFLSAIFSVFERLEIVVDVVSTSEVSVSLTIDCHDRLGELLNELREIAEVSHTGGQAIVCLVGDAIRHTAGVAATAFVALGEINVRMVSQGSSRTNLSLVIGERDVAAAVKALHHAFFDGVDLTALA